MTARKISITLEFDLPEELADVVDGNKKLGEAMCERAAVGALAVLADHCGVGPDDVRDVAATIR